MGLDPLAQRIGLMCANPRCWYQVHGDPSFGGYCCKKCHWRHATQSKGKQKHGQMCPQVELPQGASRAPSVPPDKPCDFGSGDVVAVATPSRSSTAPKVARNPIDDKLKSDSRPIEVGSQQEAGGRKGQAQRRDQQALSSGDQGRAEPFSGHAMGGWKRGSPMASDSDQKQKVSLIDSGELVGNGYGKSIYKLYEALARPEGVGKPTLLFVWLHGADGAEISVSDLQRIHGHLQRSTYFLVPMNPNRSEDGYRFNWGVRFTKGQNKSSLGFVFGEMHEPYLEDTCKLVRSVARRVGAAHVCASGYSMGGLGVYQLAVHDPSTFDVVIPVAGYILGTLEPPDVGYCAPQPQASDKFWGFLERYAHKLARVPSLLAVHAERDSVSSYTDAAAIIDKVRSLGGRAKLLTVPDDMADSDRGSKKAKRSGHQYFYTLINDTGEGLFYAYLRGELANIQPRWESNPDSSG
jgi:dienelactone hydrolase